MLGLRKRASKPRGKSLWLAAFRSAVYPQTCSNRSHMPVKPCPGRTSFGPRPSSLARIAMPPSVRASSIQRFLAAACRITFVIISWTHRRTVCARIGSFNSQVVGHQEMDLWRGNTGDECSQRLGEPDGISAPQGADNVSDIG